MRNVLIVVLAVFAAFTLAGCKKKEVLHLYCWADYVAPELIHQFENENGCRVVYDTFDSNEALLAKLQAGASGYDIIFPSHYVVGILAKSGRLMELDHSRLGVKELLDDKILSMLPDGECRYSVPYMMSYTGIGYNKDAVKDFRPSWTMFNRTDLHRRATLLDDKREVIGAALLTAGLDPNSTKPEDLQKAKEIIAGWTPNVSKFENEQYKNGLASKEFHLVMGYSGDIGQVIMENPNVTFVIPEEGCLMSCDMMCIPNTAKNVDLAYKFIKFIHVPENVKMNIEYTAFLCPNKAAYPLLSEETRSDPTIFVGQDVFMKSRFISDQGENEAIYNDVWQDVKSGK